MNVTPDDSCYCNLCDPPKETSLAMLPYHLEHEHGIDPDDIASAPILEAPDDGD